MYHTTVKNGGKHVIFSIEPIRAQLRLCLLLCVAGVSKGKVPAGRQMVAKAKTPSSKANPPAGTPARPLEAVFGSGLKSVKRGLTVASKPCTLVVQRSNKKPTQVGR